jgi:hypothetical protein
MTYTPFETSTCGLDHTRVGIWGTSAEYTNVDLVAANVTDC